MEDQFIVLNHKKQPITWLNGNPSDLDNYKSRGSSLYYVDLEQFGHIIFQHFNFKDYHLWMTSYTIKERTSIQTKAVGDNILLYYMAEGQITYKDKIGISQVVEENVYLMPASLLDHELMLEPGSYRILLLFIPRSELKQYQLTFPVVERIIYKIEHPVAAVATDHDIRDNGRIKELIGPLLSKEPRRKLDRAEVAKLIEDIILIGLDLYSGLAISMAGLSDQERTTLLQIKTALLNNIYHLRPPSLQQLASWAAMSEKKLEDLFKLIYGISMFDFFQTARMEAIHRKLTDPGYYLQQLSEDFGYDNYSSFSTAVRKRFGKSPRDIRKQYM